MQQFCAYRDRCRDEVSKKLKEFDLSANEIEQIFYLLEEERFLDEKRFANSFARGKFRIKKWGKIKITRELFARKIPPELIEEALKEIGDVDYKETLLSLISKKYPQIKGDDGFTKKI